MLQTVVNHHEIWPTRVSLHGKLKSQASESLLDINRPQNLLIENSRLTARMFDSSKSTGGREVPVCRFLWKSVVFSPRLLPQNASRDCSRTLHSIGVKSCCRGICCCQIFVCTTQFRVLIQNKSIAMVVNLEGGNGKRKDKQVDTGIRTNIRREEVLLLLFDMAYTSTSSQVVSPPIMPWKWLKLSDSEDGQEWRFDLEAIYTW